MIESEGWFVLRTAGDRRPALPRVCDLFQRNLLFRRLRDVRSPDLGSSCLHAGRSEALQCADPHVGAGVAGLVGLAAVPQLHRQVRAGGVVGSRFKLATRIAISRTLFVPLVLIIASYQGSARARGKVA